MQLLQKETWISISGELQKLNKTKYEIRLEMATPVTIKAYGYNFANHIVPTLKSHKNGHLARLLTLKFHLKMMNNVEIFLISEEFTKN